MKNLHLLPTDKASRLCINGKNQMHIYITNSEEINLNDYITDGYRVWKWKDDSSLLGRKKIILTTDEDLIKDAIQSIDDEFLEWFIKNPSCEMVEVELKTKQLVKPYDVYNEIVSYYKIIIPKEEPKHIPYTGKVWEPPKQETLEEATERVLANNIDGLKDALQDDDLFFFYKGVIQCYGEAMAKYQAEKMYSEEEVLELLTQRCKHFGTNVSPFNKLLLKQDLEWFEQFKKK